MKRTRLASTIAVTSVGCFAAATHADIVATLVGSGADVEMREHSNSSSNGASMNARTSSNGDRNEIMGLAFDLSGFVLANLTDVTLNLTSFRTDTSTRVVDLYGVAQGTAAAEGSYTTEDWNEASLPTFGSLPGLLATDSDYSTQSINTAQTTYLGQWTIASSQPGGSVQTLSDPAITAFINGYTGGTRVTFLVAAGNTSTGQFRIASKEASALDPATGITGDVGDFAPYLEFNVIPEPSSLALLGLGGLALLMRRRD